MSYIILAVVSEGEMLLGTSDEKEIAEKFIAMGCKIVATKLGVDRCYVASENGGSYEKGFPIENPVDTVGFGDEFAAGFLSGILKNFSIKECGQYENEVGSMATLVQGDMEGFPYLNQLMIFMGKKKVIDR